MRYRMLAATTAAALVAVACGGAEPTESATSPDARPTVPASDDNLAVAVASFDLAVGDDQRFIAGLLTPERVGIVGGEVEMVFTPPMGTGEDVVTTTAEFLPVPGLEPETDVEGATIMEAADGVGVYEATLDLDRPGFWEVAVTTTVDGEERVGAASFEVLEEHQIVDVGDPAPKTETLTVDSDAAPKAAIDSRAGSDGDVPDPGLHDITIAEAMARGRPTVVVFSTPVYCVSRFCGPITDTVEDLSETYGDRAEFIHVEIWEDFNEGVLNPAVEEWILPGEGSGGEPWVFLIGADGNIAARWDNVLDREELVAHLDDVPAT
ncbi:MAG: thioredoxin family protein [Actinobacteria bacterium]|nr:thioredoxin family protein [Actinomycetota bacterium]